VFDGQNVVFCWTDQATIYLWRFTPSLKAIDPQPIVVTSQGSTDFRLAGGNGTVLITWSGTQRDSLGDIYAALFRTADPLLSSSQITIGELTFRDAQPTVAWNGSEFLVVWAHNLGPIPFQGLFPDPPDRILGVRVDAHGSVLDTVPFTIAEPGFPVANLALASNGHDFFTVWGIGYFGSTSTAIYGAPINSDGSAPGRSGERVSFPGPHDFDRRPFIVALGNRYAVVWGHTTPDGVVTQQLRVVGEHDEQGSITTLPIPVNHSGETTSLVANGSTLLVAYDRIAYENNYGGVSRVFTQLTGPLFLPHRRAIGHWSGTSPPVACHVVLLEQCWHAIDVEAGETTALPEGDQLKRLPGILLGVRPSGETNRFLDEPAHGGPFLCRTRFELLEDLFVDRDRRSHDAW
jgi:hypothetical protein